MGADCSRADPLALQPCRRLTHSIPAGNENPANGLRIESERAPVIITGWSTSLDGPGPGLHKAGVPVQYIQRPLKCPFGSHHRRFQCDRHGQHQVPACVRYRRAYGVHRTGSAVQRNARPFSLQFGLVSNRAAMVLQTRTVPPSTTSVCPVPNPSCIKNR
jgi:hypothetical protein